MQRDNGNGEILKFGIYALHMGYLILCNTMYRQLQQKVKEYIVYRLCGISKKWKVDIDMQNDDKSIIVVYGPNNVKIMTSIEEFAYLVPREFSEKVLNILRNNYHSANVNIWIEWTGCFIIRQLFLDVFKIYGIVLGGCDSQNFKIQEKHGEGHIKSHIYGNVNYSTNLPYFISPFMSQPFNEYIMKEQLVSPLLLLLDPIKYFKQYSMIIRKYGELDIGHTLGIYELLLEYFPEVGREFAEKRWLTKIMFWDLASDIGKLICGLLFILS